MKTGIIRSFAILIAVAATSLGFASDAPASLGAVDKLLQLERAKSADLLKVFSSLKATNNITIIIAKEDYEHTIAGVVEVRPQGSMWLVRYKASDGREYLAIIDPTTIAIIKEGPKQSDY